LYHQDETGVNIVTTSIRILIIDDEADFAHALSRRLRRLGASVNTALNAADAYEILETNPVDVVLLDMNMPDLNGLETLKIIRRNFEGVRVILLTGGGDMSRAMKAMKAGAFDYLHKPVPFDCLWGKIRNMAKTNPQS
jgi:DNA-binding NtrC family response regulator